MEWRRGGDMVTDDPDRIDREVVHRFLSEESYWAAGISRGAVDRAIGASICLSLLCDGEQAGFARIVTDGVAFAYLADVFVRPPWRGRGLGSWLVACAVDHPEAREVRVWLLLTRDAQPLYRRHGFVDVGVPGGPPINVMARRGGGGAGG